jgi:hypothetical protein
MSLDCSQVVGQGYLPTCRFVSNPGYGSRNSRLRRQILLRFLRDRVQQQLREMIS